MKRLHGFVLNWNDTEEIWHHTFYNELEGSASRTSRHAHECSCDEPHSQPRTHDADHVRGGQRARLVRDDPGRIVSVRVETHDGPREELWRRFVALCSFLRGHTLRHQRVVEGGPRALGALSLFSTFALRARVVVALAVTLALKKPRIRRRTLTTRRGGHLVLLTHLCTSCRRNQHAPAKIFTAERGLCALPRRRFATSTLVMVPRRTA